MTTFSMIDIDTWSPTMQLSVYGGGFLVCFACMLGRFYICKKYLGRMLEAFGRSPEARMWNAILNRGLLERVFLVTMLGNLFMLSRIHIRQGNVSAQDIQDLPRELKRVFLIDGILMVGAANPVILGFLVDLRTGA